MADEPVAPPPPGRLTRRQLVLRGVPLLGLPVLLVACGEQERAASTVPAEPASTGGTAPASPPTTTAEAPASPTAAPGQVPPPASPAATLGAGAATPVDEAAAGAGDASPVALDPAARLDRFMAISAVLVGGGKLDPDRGRQFLALADADPQRRTALDALIAAGPGAIATPTAPPAASPEATPIGATPEIGAGRGGSAVVATPEDAGATPAAATPVAVGPEVRKDLLTFWYRGVFNGEPVPEREAFWFGLSAWQAVEYTTATSACKAFGAWATAPAIGTA